MLETFEVSKVLIIAPLRVACDTWPAEIEKWDHLQGLDISVIVGNEILSRLRLFAKATRSHFVLVIDGAVQ